MTSSRRTRLTGSTLLAAAVGLVVVLDTGVVPMPYSTPRAATGATRGGSTPSDPGAGPGATGAPAALQARDDGISATVTALSQALATGAPVDALVAPGEAAVARGVRRLVHNVRVVPGASAELEWDRREPTPSAQGDLGIRLGLTSRMVTGEIPAYDYVYARVRQVSGRWLLSGWDPVEDPNEAIPQTPFLLPVDIAVVRKPHVLLLGTAGVERLDARLAGRAESAAVQARGVFPQPGWDGTVVVYAFTEKKFLERVFGPHEAGTGDPHPYSWWTYETSGGGLRIALGAGYLAVDDAESRMGVRRAVGYGAALTTNGRGVPDWMIEGVSLYVSTRAGAQVDPDAALERRGLYDETWRAVRRGTWTPRLPDAADEITTTAQRESADDSAWLAYQFIADRYGEARMQAAWDAVSGRTDYGEARERAAFNALGTTRAAFVRDLQAWTRRLVARSG
ncbi:hypothetical protein [Kineosporia sp. A_224]|uniref:hypothetical protein n=1 Tax=Kineosporia sp. A_224 TaxID=1962180 RepID=UPI000B4BD150|nr:hypothetical protein [Kineosporia sp. A_224]